MGKKLGKLKNENGEKIWKIGTIVEISTKLKKMKMGPKIGKLNQKLKNEQKLEN